MKNKYVFGIIAAVIVIVILVVVGFMTSETASYEKPDTERSVLGASDAAIVLQEFSDFQCPACQNAAPVVKELLEKYGDVVRFEYHHFPLTKIHANAFGAALAAECANDQGKFLEMHDVIFENQDRLTKGNLKGFAGELGLDQESFDSCLDSRSHNDTVNADIDLGNELRVNATPTFFLNDQKIRLQDIDSAIQALLF